IRKLLWIKSTRRGSKRLPRQHRAWIVRSGGDGWRKNGEQRRRLAVVAGRALQRIGDALAGPQHGSRDDDGGKDWQQLILQNAVKVMARQLRSSVEGDPFDQKGEGDHPAPQLTDE